MNKANLEKLNLTKAQIEEASATCKKISELLKANKPEKPLDKANPSDEFFDNPQQVVLTEEAIKTAPSAFVALAAFVAQSVEGIQNAISILNDKVDALRNDLAESNGAVLKAQASTLDLVKAIDDQTPATAFRSPAAYIPEHQAPLNKANQPTRGYIISKLEKMVENKEATAQDVALFEGSGHLRQDLRDAIEASWRADRSQFK